MSEASTEALIRARLEQLQPVFIDLRDESSAHAGHTGHGGKGHFRLRIVSTCFSGLRPVQRHRLVNSALEPLFETRLHAIAMETLTPEEFDR